MAVLLLPFSFQPPDGAKFSILLHVLPPCCNIISYLQYMSVISVAHYAQTVMRGYTFYTQLQLKMYHDCYLFLKAYGSLPLVIYLL